MPRIISTDFRKLPVWLAISITTCGTVSCKKNSDPGYDPNNVIVINSNGDIAPSMDQFRQILGITVNTTPGAVGGHREINWEGVPDSLMNKTLPTNFFNTTDNSTPSRQRGLAYEVGSGEFRVSNNNFADVNSVASSQFSAYSGTKSFANISSNLWQIDPQVAGVAVAATVKGFGIVFSDVDENNTTFMEFFNEKGSLGKFYATAHNSSSSFTFLGVYFKNEKITAIKVGHDGVLADGQKDISQGGPKDLVTLDDLLYDEPVKKD